MTKIAFSIALLVISFTCAYAHDDNKFIADSVVQLSKDQREDRGELIRHVQAIEALRNQVAANQPASNKQASIDYARYDRASHDCAGVGSWVPNPATKEHDAVAFNNQTPDGFKQFIMDCMTKRTTEDFAADARRAQKRDQRMAAMTPPPPAPGAIQDEQDVDQGDDQAAPQQVGYHRGYAGRGVPHCPPGFHMDDGSCTRFTEVQGYSKYNVADDVARCKPGSTRTITVRGPFGPRKVDQTCNVHH